MLVSLLTYSQDSLSNPQDTTKAKVFPIVYKGNVYLAMDTITGKEMAHKLQEGRTVKKELDNCDSVRMYLDSAFVEQKQISRNLSLELMNSKQQNYKEREKTALWQTKYRILEDDFKSTKKKMWIGIGCGTAAGIVTGIITGILINNK